MKKIITLLLTVLILLIGCSKKEEAAASNTAEEKTYEFNYAVFFPATHLQAQTAEAWAKEVEKRTNGRIKISMFHGGTLSKAAQTSKLLKAELQTSE